MDLPARTPSVPPLPPTGSTFEAYPMPIAPVAPVLPSPSVLGKQVTYTYPTPVPAAVGTVVPVQQPLQPTSAPVLAPLNPVMTSVGLLSTGPAMLSVKQLLPESIAPGQDVAASVSITNTGGKAAEQVSATGWWGEGYDLIENGQVVAGASVKRAWTLGTLQPGETRKLDVLFRPTQGTASTEFRSGFDATFNSASDARTVKVLRPELQLAIDAPTTAFVGQPVQLVLKIKNPTTMPIRNVTIRTLLPEVLQHPKGSDLENELASIAPGATELIPLSLSCSRAGEGRARVRIGGAGCDSIEQEVKFSTVEARIALAIGGPKTLYQNWPATYEATIENQGDQPIRGVVYDVKLPAGFTDLRASDSPGYDAANHRIVWKFDQLKPGEKRTILWFGFGKQTDDLTMTGTLSIGSSPVKRSEFSTKNLGVEQK